MTIRNHSPKKQEVIPLVDWTRCIEVYPWKLQVRIQIPEDPSLIYFTSILFIQHQVSQELQNKNHLAVR